MGITYCSHTDCFYKDCGRHQHNLPEGVIISIADLNDGFCYMPDSIDARKQRLINAICKGTQNTNFSCSDEAQEICFKNGGCKYSKALAEAIEKEFKEFFN